MTLISLSFIQVAKEDISVRFFEEIDGQLVWEGIGDFQHTNVHKQVAISFRAPRYKTLEINQPVKVFSIFFLNLLHIPSYIKKLLISFSKQKNLRFFFFSILVFYSIKTSIRWCYK